MLKKNIKLRRRLKRLNHERGIVIHHHLVSLRVAA
jgi:hypothetical protein